MFLGHNIYAKQVKTVPLQAYYRAIGLQKVEDSRFLDSWVHEGGKVVSPTHWPLSPPRKYTCYLLVLEAESGIEPMIFQLVA
jgi:hypothetical protein